MNFLNILDVVWLYVIACSCRSARICLSSLSALQSFILRRSWIQCCISLSSTRWSTISQVMKVMSLLHALQTCSICFRASTSHCCDCSWRSVLMIRELKVPESSRSRLLSSTASVSVTFWGISLTVAVKACDFAAIISFVCPFNHIRVAKAAFAFCIIARNFLPYSSFDCTNPKNGSSYKPLTAALQSARNFWLSFDKNMIWSFDEDRSSSMHFKSLSQIHKCSSTSSHKES